MIGPGLGFGHVYKQPNICTYLSSEVQLPHGLERNVPRWIKCLVKVQPMLTKIKIKRSRARATNILIEMLLVIRARAAWTVNFCPKHLGTNQSKARA